MREVCITKCLWSVLDFLSTVFCGLHTGVAGRTLSSLTSQRASTLQRPEEERRGRRERLGMTALLFFFSHFDHLRRDVV